MRKVMMAVVVMGVAALGLFAPTASADPLVFTLNTVFSPEVGDSGGDPNPWVGSVTAAFEQDPVDANKVILTVTFDSATDGTDAYTGAKLTQFYFNLGDAFLGASVSYDSVVAGAFRTPDVKAVSKDAYKADGDGLYDVRVDFDPSEKDGPSDPFGVGDSAKFVITFSGGITPSDFDYLSTPAGGHGPFHAAAHVQGLPKDDGRLAGSLWIAPDDGFTPGETVLPLPASVWGVGAVMGLLGVQQFRRRRAVKA